MTTLLLLFFSASIIAIIARRLSLPYTVGLVLAGLTLSALPAFTDVHLTKEIIYEVFLPPLIFESAINIRWKSFRADLWPITLLATMGVVLSSLFVALAIHLLFGWSFAYALLFGSLIAATDPVSVIAAFKESHVQDRLHMLVEGESIVNDATGPVLFALALAYVQGETTGAAGVAQHALTVIGMGLLCGVAVGLLILGIMGKTRDPLVETTLSVTAAYGSFLLAEHFHGSGVLSVMVCGMIMGNASLLFPVRLGERADVIRFWETLAFLVNSVVFILIGIHRGHLNALPWTGVLIAVLLVTLGRAVAVYPTCALFMKSTLRIPAAYQHVLVWGGLRGAVALTLALGLPDSLPHAEELRLLTFAVVCLSVVLQGTTMPLLLKRLGLITQKEAHATG